VAESGFVHYAALSTRAALSANCIRVRLYYRQSKPDLIRPEKFFVDGGNQQNRDRISQASLSPELLICTSVDAEGIDLHRHCPRIVHYGHGLRPFSNNGPAA